MGLDNMMGGTKLQAGLDTESQQNHTYASRRDEFDDLRMQTPRRHPKRTQ